MQALTVDAQNKPENLAALKTGVKMCTEEINKVRRCIYFKQSKVGGIKLKRWFGPRGLFPTPRGLFQTNRSWRRNKLKELPNL